MCFKRKVCFVVVLLCFFSLPVFAGAGERYVAVKMIEAKVSPGIWGRVSGTFFYGDKVSVIEKKDSWIFVSKDDVSGWIKESCVTSRRIRAGGAVSVNADEIALAGKGFNKSLEAEYSDAYDIDFSDVNIIEDFGVSDEVLRDFLVDGDLMGAQ